MSVLGLQVEVFIKKFSLN